MYNYTENNDFNSILTRLLGNVSDTLDKREGSIIYDALAPAAAELAQCYIDLQIFNEQTFLSTATGDSLDNRVADFGITRLPATNATAQITTYNANNELMDVAIGTRFAVPNDFGGYNFTVVSKESTGTFLANCETSGSAGNEYIGEVLPLQSVNNLGSAYITSITKPGEDAETDTALRKRAIELINQEPFAGNKAAYRQMLIDIDGVEDVKIFPIWNGGGTVKLAVISTGHTLPSSEFIQDLQELIDPQITGHGVGLAPIGHQVTVSSPEKLDIDIEATITLEQGVTLNQVQEAIEEQIRNYIYDVQSKFADEDTLIIYLSKVSAAILNITQVKNVYNLTINSQASDLTINLSGTNVKYPMLNEVVLNVG